MLHGINRADPRLPLLLNPCRQRRHEGRTVACGTRHRIRGLERAERQGDSGSMRALHPWFVRVSKASDRDMSDLLRLDHEVFPADPFPFSLMRQFMDMYPDHLLVVEDDDGRVCGYVLATPPHNGQSWIVSLGVSPGMRGKGVARQLMLETLKKLRTADAETVLLWVEPANDPAIALYLSLGFARDPSGPRPDHFGPGAHRLLMTLDM
ncbi:GNAT family N-acetyltransferase [Streptomyces sp. NPDC005251]|uniref:GNAT family N-acetyltransferase n=1 Tax=unclassified Streptomyces TaxID=2593676 RepID=UPI00339E0ADA